MCHLTWMQCVSMKVLLRKTCGKKNWWTAHTQPISSISQQIFINVSKQQTQKVLHERQSQGLAATHHRHCRRTRSSEWVTDTGSTILLIMTSDLWAACWLSINARDAQCHFLYRMSKVRLLSFKHSPTVYRYWVLIKAITYYGITFWVLFVPFHNCSAI